MTFEEEWKKALIVLFLIVSYLTIVNLLVAIQ